MDINDISKLSPEDKDALIAELINKISTKEEEKAPSQTGSSVKKIDSSSKTTMTRGAHIVQPINQREHHNSFEDIANTIKVDNDKKIRDEDQKNWANAIPSKRRDPAELYEARCKQCGKICHVYGSELKNDPDEGLIYFCNRCSTRGGA